METKQVFERYGVYKDYIEKLELFDYNDKPKIKQLGITKAHIQRAYKEKKDENLNWSIIEYLGWISVLYRIALYTQSFSPKLTGDLSREFDVILAFGYVHTIAIKDLIRLLSNQQMRELQRRWENAYPNSKNNFIDCLMNGIRKKLKESPGIKDLSHG